MTTTIDCGIMSAKAAFAVVKSLNGKSFMKFRVSIGTGPGGCGVTVETNYQAPVKEIAGMIVHILAEDLAGD